MKDRNGMKINTSRDADELLEIASSNTLFTNEWFVVGSQQTVEYRFKQALMEYNSRLEHFEDNERNLKRTKIRLKIAERDMLKEDSESLEYQLLEMDKEVIEMEINTIEVKNVRVANEVESFAKLINDIIENNNDIENTFTSEEATKRYWVKRLGKQASIDLVSTGKISAGNLEAITQLPTEIQEEVLSTCLQYSENVSQGLHDIQKNVSSNGKLTQIDQMKISTKPAIAVKL